MNPPSDDLDPRFRSGLTALLIAIAAFGATDLALDRPSTIFSLHVGFELAFIALCLGGVAFVWRGWRGARAELAGSRQALRDREAERDRWFLWLPVTYGCGVALYFALLGEPGVAAPAPSHRDGLEAGAKGLRIAYSPTLFGARPQAEIAAAVDGVAKLYRKLGATVTEVGDFLKSPRKPYETFYVANLARLYRMMTEEQKAVVDPGFRAYVEDGMRVSLADYQEAIMAEIAFGAEVQQALVDYDLILSPQLVLTAFEAGVEVPAGRGMTRWFDWAPYTYPFNFSNHPAASVPCGFDSSHMPMSFQLVGRKAEEAIILRAARAYEREHPFRMPKAG